MKPWLFAVVGLALLASSGCRTDPAIPILERELRRKEDEIYRLRAKLGDMEDCDIVYDRRADSPARDAESRRGSERSDSGRNGKRPTSEPGTTTAPVIELPGGAVSEMPDTLKSRTGAPGLIPPEVPALSLIHI